VAVVTSPDNAAVKAARKLVRRQERARAGEFLVESSEVIREALPYLRRLFATADGLERSADLIALAQQAGVSVVEVTPAVLASLSDTVTPQGLIGVAALPASDLADALPASDSVPLLVVLSEARDPGNVGAIVRSADAGGADAVLLTSGSVDPTNPKAVRASAGSLFHLPVETWDEAEIVTWCKAQGIQLVAAAPRGAVPFTTVDFSKPTALVFGGEAHGLSEEFLAQCDTVAAVPIASRTRAGRTGSAESLNLAATVAVFVYEAARQREAA